MADPDPEQLRRRLVEIADEIRGLAPDAFAEKHRLSLEADQTRRDLEALIGDDMDAAAAQWSERAGRKGTHSVNEDEKLAQAGLPSPVDN